MYELYTILQVNKNATKKDIRKSYIKLAKIYHPDKSNFKDDNYFKNLTKAYRILINENSRKKYDIKEYEKIYKPLLTFAEHLFEKSINNFIKKL